MTTDERRRLAIADAYLAREQSEAELKRVQARATEMGKALGPIAQVLTGRLISPVDAELATCPTREEIIAVVHDLFRLRDAINKADAVLSAGKQTSEDHQW